MTRRVGYTSPERLQTVLDVVDYLVQSGFVIKRPGRGNQFIPPPAPIYIRNDSGVEIPSFACLQTTGTVEVGGQNYIKVVKPTDDTGEAGGYLFNGIAPIEIDGYGIAHDGPEVRMLTDGTAITCGDGWQPDVGAFAVVPGGTLFTAVGADDIGTNVMRGFIAAGGSGKRIFFTVTSAAIAGTSSPYNGKMLLTGTIKVTESNPSLIDTSVVVTDWSTCLANAETTAAVVGREMWAHWGIAKSLASGAPAGTLTPYHWALDGSCCP